MDHVNRDNEKTADVRLRINSWLFDWLFICGYLLILFSVMIRVIMVILDGIPMMSPHMQSQLVAAFTSIIPIILIFSVMDEAAPYASWEKLNR